jgi:hypothetical protein
MAAMILPLLQYLGTHVPGLAADALRRAAGLQSLIFIARRVGDPRAKADGSCMRVSGRQHLDGDNALQGKTRQI